jgi:penicillin amidase
MRDSHDIAHIQAQNPHDLYVLQGYVHAQDRLFQMDYARRQASGTLAEILGPAALASDVQLRTFGLRQAAQASLLVTSAESLAALAAYADGVNVYLAGHPALPPEYGALGVTHIEPWTALDSAAVSKLILFGLGFDLSDLDRTRALASYQQAGQTLGFDGAKLFSEDLFRSAPFDPASTIPDASEHARPRPWVSGLGVTMERLDRDTADLAGRYMERTRDLPAIRGFFSMDRRPNSNEWAISPALSAGGHAMIANDPHLALDMPSVWYPIHQKAGRLDVSGNMFPGAPFVALGHNRRIGWGATIDPLDLTDVFREQVVPDSTSPSGLSIVHAGALEPIIPRPEVFRAIVGGVLQVIPPGGAIPAATLIVPRRNNGPIIQFDPATGAALSVAFTGFGATRELDSFRLLDEAAGLDDFRHALTFFDSISLNFAYADVAGNIAYSAAGEVPIRRDLQPPYFIRNGTTGANDWLPVQHPQPGQAIPFEILTADEMPHLVNPPAGWFVNSNNDPTGATLDNNPLNQVRAGGGIYYLSPGYDGFRAGRATALIRQRLATHRKLTFDDMQAMQADTAMIDAQVFVPYLLDAFRHARTSSSPALRAFSGDSRIAEAVGRLGAWDFTTPTGIPEGYDAVQSNPSASDSVAATIYAVWRGQFIRRVIDSKLVPFGLPTPPGGEALTALRHLLDTFSLTHGVGGSGVSFFVVPGVADSEAARDIILLASLNDALVRLAGPAFEPAFHASLRQRDYLWGLLHRIVFAHPLGSVFNVPPAGGAFPPPLVSLPGIPTDGGFETLDRADHDARADSYDGFMFDHGPTNRSVHQEMDGRMRGVSSLPGGVSGVVSSPFYTNLLTAWLRNEAYPMLERRARIEDGANSIVAFVPAP